MATNTLASLKFTTAKKPTQVSPVQIRRNKLIGRLEEQINFGRAFAEGRTYAPTKLMVVTDEVTGEQRSVQTPKRVKTWFWNTANGKLALTIKYGSKILDVSGGKNKPTIEIDSVSQLVPTLLLIQAAVADGELDEAIEKAGKALREGFEK
jgi:hypothetical protein